MTRSFRVLLLAALLLATAGFGKCGREPQDAQTYEAPSDCARVTVNGRTVSTSACRGRKP